MFSNMRTLILSFVLNFSMYCKAHLKLYINLRDWYIHYMYMCVCVCVCIIIIIIIIISAVHATAGRRLPQFAPCTSILSHSHPLTAIKFLDAVSPSPFRSSSCSSPFCGCPLWYYLGLPDVAHSGNMSCPLSSHALHFVCYIYHFRLRSYHLFDLITSSILSPKYVCIYMYVCIYRCMCMCLLSDEGYRTYSTDVNECRDLPGMCRNGTCSNGMGSYHCTCDKGFRLTDNGDCFGMIPLVINVWKDAAQWPPGCDFCTATVFNTVTFAPTCRHRWVSWHPRPVWQGPLSQYNRQLYLSLPVWIWD